VMYNDFILVGPLDDPAGISGDPSAIDAMRMIAESKSQFVSRGDESGTNALERRLWTQAGIEPAGGWYIESGTGMGDTLNIASERAAYTITDRGTLLAWQAKLELVPLVEGDTLLHNVYHVMEVPNAGPGARALGDFFVSSEAQALIGKFGTTRFGKPLFIPDAGKPDTW